MVTKILSEKYVELTSVCTPSTKPAACFAFTGYPAAMVGNCWGESEGIGKGMTDEHLYTDFEATTA